MENILSRISSGQMNSFRSRLLSHCSIKYSENIFLITSDRVRYTFINCIIIYMSFKKMKNVTVGETTEIHKYAFVEQNILSYYIARNLHSG